MKKIKGLVWSNKRIKKMLMIEGIVLVFLIDGSAVLGGGKRPAFIPLLSIFFALANFGTIHHFCRNR